MESLQTQNALSQKIPIECFQMAEIKNDPVSFWNRPLVERVGPDNIENLVRSSSSIGQALKQLVPNLHLFLSDWHLCLQSRLCPPHTASVSRGTLDSNQP